MPLTPTVPVNGFLHVVGNRHVQRHDSPVARVVIYATAVGREHEVAFRHSMLTQITRCSTDDQLQRKQAPCD